MLITTLHEAQKADIIDGLHRILVSPNAPLQSNVHCTDQQNQTLLWFGGYLKERHSQIHITAASNKWLPSPTRKIFNLAIIKKQRIQRGAIDDEFVRRTIKGQVDKILLKKSPIELENLFMNRGGGRCVILIDGAPGSGKSTLTVHICQKWSRGELFQEFTVIVLVQLRDPAVQSAKSIADLIPCPDIEAANQVAGAIKASFGKNILWILDGWDELPSHLREKSLYKDMITPSLHSSITQSSVVVTSRTISSGELGDLVSSRIEVLGFTSKEQRLYFMECLKGDIKAVDTLMERLSKNPALEGSCYLPLNASIVANLYLSDGSLPSTIYGIFSALVQHCLSHYQCERLGKSQEAARLASLDRLPRELQTPFNQLCELAFRGILLNKLIFSQSDLDILNDLAIICKVGLLQATPSILSDGRTVYYNFMHLSIQEMLSAVYISHMSASKQISIFGSLFRDSRFSAVFQFYAAITKFRTSRPFLSKLPSWLVPDHVTVHMLDLVGKIIKIDNKPLFISVLRCLYEAQDPSLCQFVVNLRGYLLDLSSVSLTPVDSLAIGYYLYSISCAICTTNVYKIDLDNCTLGNDGTKSLIKSIFQNINQHSTVRTHLDMSLWTNDIHEEGALHIANLLNSTSIVSALWLGGNPIGDKGLQFIFGALKHNKALKILSVSYCGMTDTGLASLAEALQTNYTLERLYIGNSAITENGLGCLIETLSRNLNSGLVELWMPAHLVVDKVRKAINEARKSNELSDITVHRDY